MQMQCSKAQVWLKCMDAVLESAGIVLKSMDVMLKSTDVVLKMRQCQENLLMPTLHRSSHGHKVLFLSSPGPFLFSFLLSPSPTEQHSVVPLAAQMQSTASQILLWINVQFHDYWELQLSNNLENLQNGIPGSRDFVTTCDQVTITWSCHTQVITGSHVAHLD